MKLADHCPTSIMKAEIFLKRYLSVLVLLCSFMTTPVQAIPTHGLTQDFLSEIVKHSGVANFWGDGTQHSYKVGRMGDAFSSGWDKANQDRSEREARGETDPWAVFWFLVVMIPVGLFLWFYFSAAISEHREKSILKKAQKLAEKYSKKITIIKDNKEMFSKNERVGRFSDLGEGDPFYLEYGSDYDPYIRLNSECALRIHHGGMNSVIVKENTSIKKIVLREDFVEPFVANVFDPRKAKNHFDGPLNISDPRYQLFLTKKYKIEKNDTLAKFTIKDDVFDNIDLAFVAANDIYSKAILKKEEEVRKNNAKASAQQSEALERFTKVKVAYEKSSNMAG